MSMTLSHTQVIRTVNALVVDDDEKFRDSLVRSLRLRGIRCCCASSADNALRIIADDRSINVILGDFSASNINGISLLVELKERIINGDIVAIFVTGTASFDRTMDAIKGGAAGFVIKPVDIEDIISTIAFGMRSRSRSVCELDSDKSGIRLRIHAKKLLDYISKSISSSNGDICNTLNFLILVHIYTVEEERYAHTQNSLGAALSAYKSTISRRLTELEFKGFVERRHCPYDKRRLTLHLTDKGRDFVELDLKIHAKVFQL